MDDQELDLKQAIAFVAKEKGIEQETLEQAIEDAMLRAAEKVFKGRELRAEYDRSDPRGVVRLYHIITITDEVVDPRNQISLEKARDEYLLDEVEVGDELPLQIFYLKRDEGIAREYEERFGDILQTRSRQRVFGRIAAQSAKQVILERIRKAEQDRIYQEYQGRVGEMITGTVRRFERGNIIVDLGNVEATLPRKEKVQGEHFRLDDRLQAYLLDVRRDTRGLQVILSRANPNLVSRLFEQVVPEIYEGIVSIQDIARIPGVRTKIAVSSRDPDVDPVGACVGMKGMRVREVSAEFNEDEKIDVVLYSSNQAQYVCNAIQPARVSRVLIDESRYKMELIVPDDQLRQAIGRRGQNVSLASQLTGWNIDIHAESKILEMEAMSRRALILQERVNPEHVDILWTYGHRSLEQIAGASVEQLVSLPGIEEEDALLLKEVARELIDRRAAGEEIFPNEAPTIRSPEEEWARWSSSPALSREFFERCQDAGFASLEELAVSELDDLTEALSMEREEAEALHGLIQEQLLKLAQAETSDLVEASSEN